MQEVDIYKRLANHELPQQVFQLKSPILREFLMLCLLPKEKRLNAD